jgi:HD superfamily phosphohydrolase
MFHARYTLHKRVYSHKTSKAIEYMLVDAMVAADQYLGISDATNDPKEYLHLTDTIVKVIERSKAPELAESQSIIKRLRYRDIYRFVDQIIFPPDARKHITKEMLTPKYIVRHADVPGAFNEDDVIVHWLILSYAMKDKNPVDNTRFYSKYNENESFLIPQEHVSMLIPTNYDEAIVRVFTRDGNKRKEIQNAFRSLLASLERSFPGSVFSGSTPSESIDHTPEKHTIVADYYHHTPSPRDSPKRKMQLTPNRALTLPVAPQSPIKKRLF